MKSRVRSLIVTAALIAAGGGAGVGTGVLTAPVAHATMCATGIFYMENTNDGTFYIQGEGHNNPVQQVSIMTGRSIFCLVNSGTTNWYEFQDQNSDECLNLGSDGRVYEDSCIDSTPEQWNQPSDHLWRNRHSGNLYITALCFTTSDVTGFTSVNCNSPNPAMQSWATPTA